MAATLAAMRISSSVLLLLSLCCGATVLNAQNVATAGFVCRTSSGETLLQRENWLLLDELALHPVSATEAGYHEHNGVSLDAQLDDNSPAAMAHQRKLLEQAKECFADLDDSKVSGEDRADLTLLRSSIAERIFARDVRQPEHYRPEEPVELIGTGLFFPLTQSYARRTRGSRTSSHVWSRCRVISSRPSRTCVNPIRFSSTPQSAKLRATNR
jgi:hypothetical protein